MRRTTRLTIWLAYWVVLCVGTHLPPPGVLKVPTRHLDEIVHLLLFAVLSLCGAWALALRRLPAFCLLVVGLAGYASADEWTQAWTGRTPDFEDWLADVIGVLAGVALYRRRAWLARRRTGGSLSHS